MDCHWSLENALRNFACLTTGDVIAINYNEKVKHFIQIGLIVKALFWVILTGVVGFFQIYELRVMETKPDKAVSIIECDMNVRWQTTPECSVLVSTDSSTCFSGGFRCSFGLQRTWTATTAPRGTNCKDRTLTHKCVCEQVDWVNLFTGRRGSQQLRWHGHRLQGECVFTVSVTQEQGNWWTLHVWPRLSPALAIVWMAKQKESSPAQLL